jgi:hypothetical protein
MNYVQVISPWEASIPQLSLRRNSLVQGFSTGVPLNPRVQRDVVRGSARDRDWKKINIVFELVGQNKQIHRKNIILYSKEHWQLLLDYYIYNLMVTLTYREL